MWLTTPRCNSTPYSRYDLCDDNRYERHKAIIVMTILMRLSSIEQETDKLDFGNVAFSRAIYG